MSRSRRIYHNDKLSPAWNEGRSYADNRLPPSPVPSVAQSKTSVSGRESGQPESSVDSDAEPSNVASTAPNPPVLQIITPHMNSTSKHDQSPVYDDKMDEAGSQRPSKDLLNLRDSVITERVFVDNDLRRSLEELRVILDELGGLVNEGDGLVALISSVSEVQERAESFHKSWKAIRELIIQFRTQSLNIQQRRHALIMSETRLLRKEKEFYQQHNSRPTEDTDPQPLDSAGSSSRSETSPVHPLIARYYAYVQEFNRLRDHFIDYEANHVQQKVTRDRQRTEGQLVEPSESMFIQKYLQERKSRLSSLLAANKKMIQLWEQCKQEGLEVAQPNVPPIIDDPFLNQQHRIPQSILHHATMQSGNDDPLDITGTLLVEDSDTDSRITSWLDKLESETSRPISRGHEIQIDESATPQSHIENPTPGAVSPLSQP